MAQKSESLAAIGKRIHFWRKLRSMTLQELADEIDSTVSSLSKLENGVEGLSLERFERIADALEVPFGLMLDPELSYTFVRGLITDPGIWTEAYSVVEKSRAAVVAIPQFARAELAFASGPGARDLILCDGPIEPFSPNAAYVAGRIYAVLRKYEPADDDHLHYELCLRTFQAPPPGMGTALQEAAVSGIPARSRKLNPLAAVLSGVSGFGWFYADCGVSDPNLAHQAVFTNDSSIVHIWPVLSKFQTIS